MDKRLFGLRGAAFCENTISDISTVVVEMYQTLLQSNKLLEKDIVSIFFSLTPDLEAINPAKALREAGHAHEQALFCAAEAISKDSPQKVIRILIHAYAESTHKPVHAYIRGAESLRPDLITKSL